MSASRTWWQDWNEAMRAGSTQSPPLNGEPLSAGLTELLTDVDRAFDRLSDVTSGWDDPHVEEDGSHRAPEVNEYSRCADSQKYRILWARADAWLQVIDQRGWAVLVADSDWALEPRLPVTALTVLQPEAAGAARLVLARTVGGEDGTCPGILIAVGEPSVPIVELPQCGCDACDDGSAALLEQVDIAVLSTIDGSVRIELTRNSLSVRTSFGGHSNSPIDRPAHTMAFRTGPWARDWYPRTVGSLH
jgi:hypothetical protein